MADQVPPTQSDSNLPEKMRVHALAKLLGLTSKQIIAEATNQGLELKSAQSSVTREVAERLRDAIASSGASTPAVEVSSDADVAQVSSDPDISLDFSSTPQPPAPAAAQPSVEAPLFLQPDLSAAPPRRTRTRRPAAETKVAEVADGPEVADVAETVAEAPTALDAQTADDTTDQSGPGSDHDSQDDDQPRRRRRGRRGRGRGRGEQADQSGDGDDGDADTAGASNEAASGETATDETASGDASGETASGEAASGDAAPSRSRNRRRRSSAERKADEAEKAEATDSDKSDSSGDSAASESGENESDTDSDGNDDAGDGASRRRRRRRRRRTGAEGSDSSSEDDPPNTVVHEREPRNKSRGRDEVQGISGSTRLEAKRQRRRDGRDAGRRRPPILTESEFLARREAVDRVMVVRDRSGSGDPHNTTQVAVLEDRILVEHFVTSSSTASMVGNVYLGRVQNVLPSMEAAFIDIGRGRNGVLYAGEVNWEAAGLGGNSRKIEQALKPGDQVLVQVSKDPVGHKGARLTTQISLAGRFLVYVPDGSSTGISRKLPDTERKRLKEILREIVPTDAGVIIRTAAEGVSEDELARDVTRLQSQWETIREQSQKAQEGKSGNPKALYEEPDLLVKVVRDLFNEDFSKLVVEGDKAWETIESYIGAVAPDLLPRLEKFDSSGQLDVFGAHRIDEQLAKALDRKVWLPSGGTLVIDRTEAMTVVDVNTGKFTGAGGNLEETVTRNNLEAAEEVVRQMRLRDIGGMIVVDFIDMVLESNRDLVLRRLTEALGRDRTRHQVSEVTSLGLVQMTRKKLGTGLVEAFSTNCEHCHGRGIIVHSEPIEPKQESRTEARNESRTGPRQESRQESRRSKRGKDNGKDSNKDIGKDTKDGPEDGVESREPVAAEPEVDASVKRAHPVALAMAGHHSDEPTAQLEPTAAAQPEQTAAAQPEQTAAAQPEQTAAAQPEPDSASTSTQPVRRRSRRVSRAAAAPSAAESAGTVFVLPKPVAEPESSGESSPESAPEPVVISRPRRRRAAGRPAGPPVDGAPDEQS